MSAMPSNKSSPSPPSKPNPMRNSEIIGSPMRRSFTDNPFAKPSIIANPRCLTPNTPANSPSENLRRSSMGRATVVTFRDSEDKENGKDQNWKPIKVRSPGGLKGTKNFMSPTISAASKVTAASPRKKILAERNEPVWSSSVSLSDSKIPAFNPTVEDDSSVHVEVSSSLTSPLVFKTPKTPKDVESKKCAEPVCENACVGPDIVNLDPSFKISPPASCPASGPVIAPLDADPSAPYDPKTNFLSPRPQFLHYRPNPRIEYYLSKEKDGKRLEESFLSRSFSDTEATEETESDDSQKELEDVTSEAMVDVEQPIQEEPEEEGVKEEEEEVRVSEPSPISPVSTFISKEEAVEVKGSKPRFFSRSKFTALLLLLAVALLSLSVIHSPVIESSVLKDLSFLKEYDGYEVAEYARASIDGLGRLARNFWVWSANSVSFISELISELRGEHNLGPLQYCNLTALVEDVRVDGYSVFDQSDKGMEAMYEFDVFAHTTRIAVGIEATDIVEVNVDPEYEEPIDEEAEAAPVDSEVPEEMDQPEIGEAENIVQVVHVDPEYEEQVVKEAEGPVNIEEVSEGNSIFNSDEAIQAADADVVGLETSEGELSQEENVVIDHANWEAESIVSVREETVLVSLADKVQIEISDGVQELQAESEMSTGIEEESLKHHSPIISEVDGSSENVHTAEELEVRIDETESKVSLVNVMGVAALVLALIGSTAFIYSKKMKNSTSSPAVAVAQPLMAKKLEARPTVPVSTEHNTVQEGPYSSHWISEPCSSETSSIQKSSSYRTKGLKAADEAESQEKRRRNYRRESTASIDSSMGSPSYGSFTTYEKIPIKHRRDEEVVTPVRRSSRIRQQVTSP